MNELAARRAFDNAIKTHKQDFGNFFLTRLFGMELVAFATSTWKSPHSGKTAK